MYSATSTKHVVVRRMQRKSGMFTSRSAMKPAATLTTKVMEAGNDLLPHVRAHNAGQNALTTRYPRQRVILQQYRL